MEDDFGFHKTDEVAASLGADITGVVVGFDMKINYLKMSKASIVVSRAGDSAVFVATNTDEQFPIRPGVFMPGGFDGCLCHYLQTASLSHLRTILPESSSQPMPAQRPNHAS